MKALRHSSFSSLIALLVVVSGIGLGQKPGRNVNVIGGVKDQFVGDRFLQRQNEPTIAVSSRNPDHLLAAANDYRTIDFVDVPELTADPGLNPLMVSEGWMGVYRSYDRGRTWITSLLPGFPQDTSPEGAASPISGFPGASDPVIASGLSGRIYLGGLVYDRQGESAIFVARYTDLNNLEGGDSFHFDFANIVASKKGFDKGKLEDKPAIAVDIPRKQKQKDKDKKKKDDKDGKGSNDCESVYVAFTQFDKLNANGDFNSKLMFSRSIGGGKDEKNRKKDGEDGKTNDGCGSKWSKPKELSKKLQKSKDGVEKRGQGSAIAIDPRNGTIYVAWRTFFDSFVLMVKSTDGGEKFSKPVSLTGKNPFFAFDQFQPGDAPGANPYDRNTFRTNAFPSIAVDLEGRVHVAWQERVDVGGNPSADGAPRIVLTTSSDEGESWTPRHAVDFGVDSGPQVMPSLTAGVTKDPSGAKESQLMLLYYESSRSKLLDAATGFISGVEEELNVHVARARAGDVPHFDPPVAVSQYAREAFTGDIADIPGAPGFPAVNRPNLPMYQNGTTPFIGDYITLVPSLPFVLTDSGWQWGVVAAANGATGSLDLDFSYHAIWTDNRDVVFPSIFPGFNSLFGDWSRYSPPGTGDLSCLNPGSRNANIYSAEVTNGAIVGSPGTFKQLGLDANGKPIQRAFLFYVQNQDGAQSKFFRLTIVDDRNAVPPVVGSFFQSADQTTLDILVFPNSTVTQTVYVGSANPVGSVKVEVNEIVFDQNNQALPGDFSSSVGFNADPTNPKISNPKISNTEIHNPKISNPKISNPKISNPKISNPKISNPKISNPQVSNPKISNPKISNPKISNPKISNVPVADITWTVTNEGNTTSAYTPFINVEEIQQLFPNQDPESIGFQLILFRTTVSPTSNECDFVSTSQDSVISVINNPKISNPKISNPKISNPKISNPKISNSTVFIAPGDATNPNLPQDAVKVTLRIFPPADFPLSSFDAKFQELSAPQANNQPSMLEQSLTQTVVAETINTIGGELADNAPATAGDALLITTADLPDANVGVGYLTLLTSVGGQGAKTWDIASGALPPGLFLNSTTAGDGIIAGLGGATAGIPGIAGLFTFTARVTDGAGTINSREFILSVVDPNTTTQLTANPTSATLGQTVTFTAQVALKTGSAIPTGTVTFLDNGTNLVLDHLANGLNVGAVPLVNGVVTFPFSTLPPGTHAITAAYTHSAGSSFEDSVSGLTVVTVAQPLSQPTTTTVSSSANPSVLGEPVALVARVSLSSNGLGTPTGTVTFKDNGLPIGTSSLNPLGDATLTTAALSVGSHSITAEYSGALNDQGAVVFNPGVSSVFTQVVNPSDTSIRLLSSPNPSPLGQTVTFIVKISASPPSLGPPTGPTGPIVPTGTVTLLEGNTVLGNASLDSAAQATIPTGALTQGAHSITAVYNGDSNYASSSSGILDHTVNDGQPQATTAGVSASVNPSVFGQPVVLIAEVSANTGTPTGSVTFKDGAVPLGTATLDGLGRARLTTSTLTTNAAHAITAEYGGDPNYNPSVSPSLPHTVDQAVSSTEVLAQPNPSTFGQSVILTALVNPTAPSLGVPTGSVQFQDNGSPLAGSIAVVGGQAQLSTSSLPAGTHTITAAYGGDTNFVGGTGTLAGGQLVDKAIQTITFNQPASPAAFNISFGINPTSDSGLVVSVIATGVCSISGGTVTMTSGTGTCTLTASQGGDSNYNAATDVVRTVDASQASASVTLGNLSNHTFDGTAKVATVTTIPTGLAFTVTYDGSATAPTNAASYAVVATVTDANYQGSANGTLVIDKAGTTTTVASSQNPLIFGQVVTFTATVTAVAPGAGVPTGTVAFGKKSFTLSGGQASVTSTLLSIGTHAITAAYGGDANFLASTSATLTQTVTGGLIHKWPGEGNAFDIIGSAHGTLNGATFTTGKVGQGFDFDGTNDFISFGTGPAITGTGPFTIEAWIKTTDTRGVIINQRDTGNFNGEYILSVGGVNDFATGEGKICWGTYGDNQKGFDFCSASSVNDGAFHHIVVTREMDGTGRIYIDGVLDSSQSVPSRTLVVLNVFLGVDHRDIGFMNLGDKVYLAGIIDEVSLYGRALSATEIQTLFNASN